LLRVSSLSPASALALLPLLLPALSHLLLLPPLLPPAVLLPLFLKRLLPRLKAH
jgi:hypothetical protein